MAKKNTKKKVDINNILPVIPLKDKVVFPGLNIPCVISKPKAIESIKESALSGNKVILVWKKNDIDGVQEDDIAYVGCLARIIEKTEMPDGTIKVMLVGEDRVHIKGYIENLPFLGAVVTNFLTTIDKSKKADIKIYTKIIRNDFFKYAEVSDSIPQDVLDAVRIEEDLLKLIDIILSFLPISEKKAQEFLETEIIEELVENLMIFLAEDYSFLEAEKAIKSRVASQIDNNNREYYLHEQMKAIQIELKNDNKALFLEYKNLIKTKQLSKEAVEKANNELKKLSSLKDSTPEFGVIKNYLDVLLNMPWGNLSDINLDLKQADDILNEQHYGLDEVKERIIEFLAVQTRNKKVNGTVLCLIGPPGVGKTSLAKSIAKATSREYIKMSLGGLKDESEIRGHRRTYIGSMPGQIVKKIATSKVDNPFFLLDEIDKMSSDFKGDPSSAMLEVLDPSQNHKFNDNFLEIDYDLSNIMFFATANSYDIPAPLLDRMEIIDLSSYTENEKLSIAIKYLVKRQKFKNGLKMFEISFTEEAILEIIRYYTREAGVRELERLISKICRKVLKKILLGDIKRSKKITVKNLEEYLGVKKFQYGSIAKDNKIGEVTGLAWTSVGGEILTIQATSSRGKGKLISTGKLGEIMQESIQTAFSVVKSLTDKYNIPDDYFEKHDLHIHVPEGATPKDGPSAGVGMVTVLLSVITNKKILSNTAMTGEVTLSGTVLAIGGLKEKLISAKRAGILNVFIPFDNKKDLTEIPDDIRSELNIMPVKYISKILEYIYK